MNLQVSFHPVMPSRTETSQQGQLVFNTSSCTTDDVDAGTSEYESSASDSSGRNVFCSSFSRTGVKNVSELHRRHSQKHPPYFSHYSQTIHRGTHAGVTQLTPPNSQLAKSDLSFSTIQHLVPLETSTTGLISTDYITATLDSTLEYTGVSTGSLAPHTPRYLQNLIHQCDSFTLKSPATLPSGLNRSTVK